MKKTIFIPLFLASFILPLVSCGHNNSQTLTSSIPKSTISSSADPISSTVISPYAIKITPIGSGTIQVTKTVTLRTSVTGTTKKDVTWSSLTPDIATVTDRGVVTGISKGIAEIKATLVIDPNCSAVYKVTVEAAEAPEQITITGHDSNVAWVGENLNLSVSVSPESAVALVDWQTSDQKIATISETGLITFIKKGSVTITAVSKADPAKTDSVVFEVRYGTFLTNTGSDKWNFDKQDDENDPHILLNGSDEDSAGYNSAWFAHYKGKRFYAEATFKCFGNTTNTWDWQGFGLGSGLNDSDARFFTYSPHSPVNGNPANKCILRDRPETWGALTTRSQIWGENGLNDITIDDIIKIGLLRYDNEYYYLINDKVFYYDQNEKYDGIDTIPYVISYDLPVKVYDYKLTTEEISVHNMMNSDEFQKSFFAANPSAHYTDDADFSFTSLDQFSKNQRIKSLGDKAKVYGNFEIEFDVSDLAFKENAAFHTGLTVNMTRYDTADVIDTVSLGKSVITGQPDGIIGRFSRWDYTQSFQSPNAVKDWYETTRVIITEAAATSHVKIRRIIDGDYAYFHLAVDGSEYVFDLGAKGSVTGAKSTYTGAYLLWVAGEYSTSHVTNFTYRSNLSL